jgi:hypothetical protein
MEGHGVTRQDKALARLGQIGDQRLTVLIENLRAGRHRQHNIVALGACAVLAHAMPALLGLEMLFIAIVEERVEIGDAFHDHVAAPGAVTAVRTAELDELLAAETDGAFATIAGAHINLGGIEKLHDVGLALEAFGLH